MIATKALKDAGVSAKMIPKPARVETPSNLCLMISAAVEHAAVTALRGANIELGGVVK
jgi:hypothetical protein